MQKELSNFNNNEDNMFKLFSYIYLCYYIYNYS